MKQVELNCIYLCYVVCKLFLPFFPAFVFVISLPAASVFSFACLLVTFVSLFVVSACLLVAFACLFLA